MPTAMRILHSMHNTYSIARYYVVNVMKRKVARKTTMKKTKEKPKMYVIKKYIKASCASEAISFDSKTPVHDVWVDSD